MKTLEQWLEMLPVEDSRLRGQVEFLWEMGFRHFRKYAVRVRRVDAEGAVVSEGAVTAALRPLGDPEPMPEDSLPMISGSFTGRNFRTHIPEKWEPGPGRRTSAQIREHSRREKEKQRQRVRGAREEDIAFMERAETASPGLRTVKERLEEARQAASFGDEAWALAAAFSAGYHAGREAMERSLVPDLAAHSARDRSKEWVTIVWHALERHGWDLSPAVLARRMGAELCFIKRPTPAGTNDPDREVWRFADGTEVEKKDFANHHAAARKKARRGR